LNRTLIDQIKDKQVKYLKNERKNALNMAKNGHE